MALTIEEIRHALDAEPSRISPGGIISKGTLIGSAGEVDYTIHLGWDLCVANLCDRTWGAFNVALLRHIRELEVEGVNIAPILESASLEDNHWRWLDKSLYYRGDCYKWFFLIAEDYPQAACLIYHPKSSVVDEGDIFYIEYLATAPWNRKNILAQRVFKGVGQKLLERVIAYAKDDLKLRAGFSLHSLPKAVPFYEKIGMKAFPLYDKEGLKFFEWVDPETQEKR